MSAENSPILPHQLHILNDTVMGGNSISQVSVTADGTCFSGHVSLDNNGGFASMRGHWPYTNNIFKTAQTKDPDVVQLTVIGDGQKYQFRLYTKDNEDGSAYAFEFDTKANKTLNINAPLSAFKGRYRGQPVHKPALRLENIGEYGLLIGDNQEGEFRLLLKAIILLNP